MKDSEKRDFLKEAKRLFALSGEVEKDNRDAALGDIKFALLSEQWEYQDQEYRRRKGKPCLTINKLPTHIRQVVNDARQNKPSIKINPVDSGADPETANILTGLIRNIENTSKADIAYDTGIFQSVSSGYGYWRVNIEYAHDDSFDRDIVIDRIPNQFSVYGDPYSTSADGSDWNVCFITDKLTKQEFREKYKDKAGNDWEVLYGYDRLDAPWGDGDNVTVAEYWVREENERVIYQLSDRSVIDAELYDEQPELFQAVGLQVINQRTTKSHKVTQYILSGAEILEEHEWPGKFIPIIPCYGEEIICEGKRTFKSLVRDAKDAQRYFNYWRTKSTEHVSQDVDVPYIVEEGVIIDPQKWATANREKYAYLEYKKGAQKPSKESPPTSDAASLQEALNAADDIQSTMGMFNPSLGAQSNETSGKAIIARQRESDTGTYHFIDNLSRAIRYTGNIIVDLIPSVYSGERVIRVLGEDLKKTQNVKIGDQGEQQNEMGEIEKIYDLSLGKYDVTVTSGANYTTQRVEAANQMVELIRVNPAVAPVVMGKLVKSLDWPGADEIAEQLEANGNSNPAVQQLQQQLQQMQQIMLQLQQQNQQLQQDKSIETEKVKIDAYKAESDRLKIMSPVITPQDIQALVIQTVQQVMQTPDITPGVGVQQQFQQQIPQGTLQQ